jgi:hypothetical protein
VAVPRKEAAVRSRFRPRLSDDDDLKDPDMKTLLPRLYEKLPRSPAALQRLSDAALAAASGGAARLVEKLPPPPPAPSSPIPMPYPIFG